MPTFVAFLRAINLGANRKFPKDDVRRVTEEAGFTGVATHINTGNVRVETSMRSRERVEAALERAYLADRGFTVSTVVLTTAELRQVAADAEELGGRHVGTRQVCLLKSEPTPHLAAQVEALSGDGEQAHVRSRAVHLLVGEQAHTARLGNAAVERLLGVATSRNVTVISALAKRWG